MNADNLANTPITYIPSRARYHDANAPLTIASLKIPKHSIAPFCRKGSASDAVGGGISLSSFLAGIKAEFIHEIDRRLKT